MQPHAMPASTVPAWAALRGHTAPTLANPEAYYIRTTATRLAADPDCYSHLPGHGPDFYLRFVQTLHRLVASSRMPDGLRWHARLALIEMDEDERE